MFNETEDYLMMLNGAVVNMDETSSFSIKNKHPEFIIFTELSGKEYTQGVVRSVCRVEKEWIEGYFKKLESVKSGDFEETVLTKYAIQKVEPGLPKKTFKLTLGQEEKRAENSSNNDLIGAPIANQNSSQLSKRSAEDLKAEKIRLAQERLNLRKENRNENLGKVKKIKF